jgi:NAD(P)-dependent dehydrogenase (short-subunit alcohol dehydrogenase family)
MSSERKVLLLTGASRGIGHATVKRFSDAAWRIITCSREAVPEECKRDPNWTHHITADLGNPNRRPKNGSSVSTAISKLGMRYFT